jgi:hypothetical protein
LMKSYLSLSGTEPVLFGDNEFLYTAWNKARIEFFCRLYQARDLVLL